MSEKKKRFGAHIFVEVEAPNMEKAKEILGKIVESSFGEEVDEAVQQMHLHDGLGNEDVWEIKDE